MQQRYILIILLLLPVRSYLVTHLMGADLNNIVKTQRLSDDHVQFLVYQILRGLKVGISNTGRKCHFYLEENLFFIWREMSFLFKGKCHFYLDEMSF